MNKILLVEDDHTISRLYGAKLDIEGYDVIYAYNGLEGLKALDNFVPDIVLLDLMMPIMDGEAFLEKFRRIEKFHDTPVLILTNLSREEAPKTLWHNGISGYFIKAHHTPKDLYEVIKKITL